jgi:hypothetical protein
LALEMPTSFIVAANAPTRAAPRHDVCLGQVWYVPASPTTLRQSAISARPTTFLIIIHTANRAPAASQIGQVGAPTLHAKLAWTAWAAWAHCQYTHFLCIMASLKHRSSCSASCLSGSQSRSRTILSPSRTATYSCPTLNDSRLCDAGACPTPDQVLGCLVSDWQLWSECSVSCGGSSFARSRTNTRPATNGGIACPATLEAAPCSVNECPVDCQVADWASWGSCSYAARFVALLPCLHRIARNVVAMAYLCPDLCPAPVVEMGRCQGREQFLVR